MTLDWDEGLDLDWLTLDWDEGLDLDLTGEQRLVTADFKGLHH